MLKRIRQIEYQIQMIWCKLKNTAVGGIQSIVAGTNVTIDNTDPLNPVVNSTGGGGGQPTESVIEVTKEQLDTLIGDSELVEGALYKINGVQPFLYGGTTIWLRAINSNALENKGTGEFFVPKYDQTIQGYGIFESLVKVEVSDSSYPSGTIYYNNVVTTDNGAIGKFKSVGLIEFVSGDWESATEMYVNGIIFYITSAVLQEYSVGETVIWGGKHWKNLTGLHGSVVDIFTLSTDWEVISFNTTDYNVDYDEIGYDYLNDCINYRRDRSDNITEFSYSWWNDFENNYMGGDMENSYSNPIKSFQWGNHYDYGYRLGVMTNTIKDSLFECINSKGNIQSNTLESSYIKSNTLENQSSINYNTLKSSNYIQNNTLGSSSYIDYNTLAINSSIQYNTLENESSINYNTLQNQSSINFNTLAINSSIQYNTLENQSSINYNTLKSSSSIYSNTLQNQSSINYNTLQNQSSINFNTLENQSSIQVGLANILISKTLQKLIITSGDVGGSDGVNLSSATTIFGDFPKNIFKNSAGVTRMSYWNEFDTLVITDLTD